MVANNTRKREKLVESQRCFETNDVATTTFITDHDATLKSRQTLATIPLHYTIRGKQRMM